MQCVSGGVRAGVSGGVRAGCVCRGMVQGVGVAVRL